MSNMRAGAIGLCGFLISSILGYQPPASAADWPRFRGPNGTGIAADKDIPIEWASHGAVLWKTVIPGVGNSSPIVSGERVFVQSATADGKERRLLCLNAKDGTIIWSRTVAGSMARTHPRNTLASSTPASDGDQVYAIFWDGEELSIDAFDIRGVPQWQRNLGSFTSQHGAGISPIVCQGKVIVANDQDGSSVLLALDARTGKTVWQANRRPFRACYSTPFLLERPAHNPELIVASTAGVTSYDPQTGHVNWDWTWHFSGMALRTVASPIFSQGLIVACSGDGPGERHTVAVKVDGKGDVTRNHLAWEARKTFPYVPTLLAWGNYLYFVNDRGFACCVTTRTGETVWGPQRLAGGMTASPVLIDGHIYAPAEEGDVYVFAAAPQFKLLAKNSLGEAVYATPAVADHRLFIRGVTHLFCIGAPVGRASTRLP